MFECSLYFVCLILSCIITALLGLIALQRSVNKGAVAFAGLMFGAAIFSFCYIFKVSSLSITKALFWLKAAYVGIATIPVFWYIMIYQYTGTRKELSNSIVAGLFLIPFVTLFILYTNAYHELYYSNILLTRPGTISMISFEKGPWYWVHLIYSYVLFISGYVRLIREWLHSDNIYRCRLGIFLVSAIAPWLANLLYHMKKTPQGVDISPASYAVAGLVFILGIYRYGVFELIPIARDNVFEALQDGVIVFDIHSRVVDFNTEAKKIMKDFADLEIGAVYDRILENFSVSSAKMYGLCEQREIKTIIKDEVNYYNCTLSPIINQRKAIVGKTLILRNITEQTKLRECLKTLATIDGLTNVFNRRHFLERSHKAMKELEKKDQPSAVLLFDIDLFKKVNDKYGHEAGDKVLCHVARILANCMRSTDIFARYGGEEFVCLLINASSEEAIQVAERIRKRLSGAPLDFQGNLIRITASFGVVGTDMVGKTDLEGLLKMADKALYDAKGRGRNCTCSFLAGNHQYA